MNDGRTVGVGACREAAYPERAPFDPGESYPELGGIASAGAGPNAVYDAVREALRHAGLDGDHLGTEAWDPLGDLIVPGMRVLLKPNLSFHENRGPGGADCLVTHGSVVRAVLDFVLRALDGRGEVWIADAPDAHCDFARALAVSGIGAVVGDARRRTSVAIRVVDLRRVVIEEAGAGKPGVRRELRGDPNGFVPMDLGERSLLAPLDRASDRYRATGRVAAASSAHHAHGRHEYLISRTALVADAFVNFPKLRTHGSTGMGCALENLTGISGDSGRLPHHRAGAPAEGGDAYCEPSRRRAALSRIEAELDATAPGLRRATLEATRRALLATTRVVAFDDTYSEGAWWGNDTAWRTVLDLNRAVIWARDGGTWVDERRPWLNVVDAVVCGEGDGPLAPSAAAAGCVLAGTDAAMVDLACARMSGFDVARLPVVQRAFDAMDFPVTRHRPEDLVVVPALPSAPLRPSAGWAGHLESGALADR